MLAGTNPHSNTSSVLVWARGMSKCSTRSIQRWIKKIPIKKFWPCNPHSWNHWTMGSNILSNHSQEADDESVLFLGFLHWSYVLAVQTCKSTIDLSLMRYCSEERNRRNRTTYISQIAQLIQRTEGYPTPCDLTYINREARFADDVKCHCSAAVKEVVGTIVIYTIYRPGLLQLMILLSTWFFFFLLPKSLLSAQRQ